MGELAKKIDQAVNTMADREGKYRTHTFASAPS